MYKIFTTDNQNNEIIEADFELLLAILNNTNEAVVQPSNNNEMLVLQEHSRFFNMQQNYNYVCKNYMKNQEKYLKRGDYDR